MGTQRLGLGSDPRFDSEEYRPVTDEQWVHEWRRFLWFERVFLRGYRPLFLIAFVMSLIGFLAEWAGFRGKFQPWGDPKPLGQVLWHFPATFACSLITVWVLYVFARARVKDRGD